MSNCRHLGRVWPCKTCRENDARIVMEARRIDAERQNKYFRDNKTMLESLTQIYIPSGQTLKSEDIYSHTYTKKEQMCRSSSSIQSRQQRIPPTKHTRMCCILLPPNKAGSSTSQSIARSATMLLQNDTPKTRFLYICFYL